MLTDETLCGVWAWASLGGCRGPPCSAAGSAVAQPGGCSRKVCSGREMARDLFCGGGRL